MHSRAYLLLEREFEQYEKDKIFGISVTPVGDSLMELIGEIKGLKDSLWEGAELQLSLRYSENYNRVPPRVNFNTIPFHPNVDPQSGKPCMDFLDDPTKWDPGFTITNILLSIQVLLSNPVLENAVNLEAANMLQNNYPQYRQKVIQCVKTSQHLEAIPSSYGRSDRLVNFFHPAQEPSQMRRITAISYEEYYLRWFALATSKAAEDFKSPVFEDPNFIANRYGWMAENFTKGDWDENTHQLLIAELIEREKKKKLIEGEGSIHYVPSPTPEPFSKRSSVSRLKKKSIDEDEEQWEKEVEDLVLWSTSLDESAWV